MTEKRNEEKIELFISGLIRSRILQNYALTSKICLPSRGNHPKLLFAWSEQSFALFLRFHKFTASILFFLLISIPLSVSHALRNSHNFSNPTINPLRVTCFLSLLSVSP